MIAVTTRNKLKSPILFFPMLAARRRVREQLLRTKGLIRWTDAIASPTEFFTLTLWATKQTMFDFMSSDAHREMMWMFTRWSSEFWSMRWAATDHEIGAWNGLRIAQIPNRAYPAQALSPIPDIAISVRPGAGPVNPANCSVTALTARINVSSPGMLWSLLQTQRRLSREAHSPLSPKLLRTAIGAIEPGQYLVLTLWHDYDPSLSTRLANSWRNAWVMEWQPGDYEIGHWAGLRLRQFANISSSINPHTQQTLKSAD